MILLLTYIHSPLFCALQLLLLSLFHNLAPATSCPSPVFESNSKHFHLHVVRIRIEAGGELIRQQLIKSNMLAAKWLFGVCNYAR